ncbi:hypothetical protein BS50DRAFT_597555 [Corynespora cassiicola Philippines]|uniref:Uncharacterized protein n=1 Tax=Corynespora cassiicola Philippines TaxID=1448308 RepID=A0A2T2P3A1_CORCC|nr:hypothetical protein BS50DRAFT_597555 [Corynespora cassiicola Philippines]
MVTLRSPSHQFPEAHPTIIPPHLSWFAGTWNVTHSTLPMWKKNRNVQITYQPIPNTDSEVPRLKDDVTYQSLSSNKIKTVRGIDKPFDVPDANVQPLKDAAFRASLAYKWRGKGWLKFVTSKWEILGYGSEEGTGRLWVVTYFAKTVFTPAGVDIYSRGGALHVETVESIKAALAGMRGDVAKLATEIYAVSVDGARDGLVAE